ncbi:GPP34 family phosphoprotein [Streptomyces mirabilis]|uniref:GPP34 family phosphoprotein n=1 Tax=Streptomyces mirabilis TaxID=68239 RepID=UPI000765BA69|nr:GPP34 family phosphoprotein [Streptomyces mirabilis]
MTTARDLALITLGMPTDLPVAQGALSLALAGAEAVDLLENGALSLDGDRMVPGPRVATGDRLLDQADASLTRREPYETVDDRLWRRGSELAAAYVDDLERAGLLTHPRGHRFWLGSARPVLADSQARRGAEGGTQVVRRPRLAALLAAAGIGADPAEAYESLDADAVTTALAAVGGAVTQLEAIRLRHDNENAAFDNVWRG